MTCPTSRNAAQVALRREPERSRRSSTAEEMVPSRIELAICIRSLKWVSISSQSMTLRPGVPNRASMCSYRTVGDGRQKIRSCHWRMRGIRSNPIKWAIVKTGGHGPGCRR